MLLLLVTYTGHVRGLEAYAESGDIVIDNLQSTTGTVILSPFSVTLSNFVVGSGTNKVLIIGIGSSAGTVSSVTYGGISLSKVISKSNTVNTEFWILQNPTSGTANVVVTMSGSSTVVIGAYSFFGVTQINSVPTTVTNSNVIGSPSVSITNKIPSSLVLDSVVIGTTTLTNPTKTSAWNTNVAGIISGASSYATTQPNSGTTFGWTAGITGVNWAHIAIEVQSAHITYPFSDSIGMRDSAVTTASKYLFLSDSVGLSDSVTKSFTVFRSFSGNLGLKDYLQFNFKSSGSSTTVITVSPDATSATLSSNTSLVLPATSNVKSIIMSESTTPMTLDYSSSITTNAVTVTTGFDILFRTSNPNISQSGDTKKIQISGGTTFTGSTGWDGKILLPKVTSITIPQQQTTTSAGVTTSTFSDITAFEIGVSGSTIQLSNPARIEFTGNGGTNIVAFFAGPSGIPNIIENICTSDSAAGLNGNNECIIKDGTNVMVWTNHFTTFGVGHKLTSASYSGDSAGGSSSGGGRIGVKLPVSIQSDYSQNSLENNSENNNGFPKWMKFVMEWWINEKISDNDTINIIQYLKQKNILMNNEIKKSVIPKTMLDENTKKMTKLWLANKISDNSFNSFWFRN